MSIRLLQAIFLAGVFAPADGKTLTLSASLESDLVAQGKAVWVSAPPVKTEIADIVAALGATSVVAPSCLSIAGQQREVRGQALWTPGDTLYDGGGGVGVGTIAASDRADFTGWKMSLDSGTVNAKINADRSLTGSAIASTDVIFVNVFVPNWAAGMEVTLYLSSVTNWSKFVFGGWSMNQLQQGWNELAILASTLTASGGETFPLTPLRVRMQVKNACGAGGSLYVGDIRVATAVPTLTLCIDDAYADLVRYAFPAFAKNSLLCSVFVVTDWQDQQESGVMADNTVAPWRDLQALDSRGWDIAPHTTGHQNALSYAEVGTIASAGTTATFSGVGTSGDNTINFVSSGALVFDKPRGLSFWAAGNETGKALIVAGSVAGVPTTETVHMRNATFSASALEWDTVTAISIVTAAAATVTIRAAYNAKDYRTFVERSRDAIIACGMPRAASWFAWPRGEFSLPLRNELQKAGFRIRGTVETQTANVFGGGLVERDFPSYSAGGSRTLTDVQNFATAVKNVQGIGSLFWHHVNPNGATPLNTLPATLQSELEWLAAEGYAGSLRFPTFTQLENAWL